MLLSTNTGWDFTREKKMGLQILKVSSKAAALWHSQNYLMKDDAMFVFVLVSIVFKMATGTGIAALPRTTMSRSPRSPSASSWLSSTTILCPCPRTQMQLTKSYPSKRGRSLGWEFWVDLVRYFDILRSWLIPDFLRHICMEDGTFPNQKQINKCNWPNK